MPAYNFKKQFADDVESGKKRGTIRKMGKRKPPVVGEKIKLYTGMRTKACRLLAEPVCLEVSEIKIRTKFDEVLIRICGDEYFCLFDSDKALTHIAQRDGFETKEQFFKFFAEGADENGDFYGHWIEW